MSDRLEEIKARVGVANRAIILDQPWTEPQRLEGLEASYTLVHKDIPWLIDRLFVAESNFNMADVVMRRQDAEIERLRAALDEINFHAQFSSKWRQAHRDIKRIASAALADQGGES